MSIEMFRMSKKSVTRLFVGAIVAVGAGARPRLRRPVGGLGERCNGSRWQQLHRRERWIRCVEALGLVIVGSLAILGRTIAAVVSWIGALLNTWQLDDRLWFAALLALGLLSFGVVAMIAYVVAGPGRHEAERGTCRHRGRCPYLKKSADDAKWTRTASGCARRLLPVPVEPSSDGGLTARSSQPRSSSLGFPQSCASHRTGSRGSRAVLHGPAGPGRSGGRGGGRAARRPGARQP